jgi:hypothetical protein
VHRLWKSRYAACVKYVNNYPALVWYESRDTQCVVAHEGGFTSVSKGGTYHGRFQMDQHFERETALGRWAQRTYGRASNWPKIIQVRHAYMMWKKFGWSRWPTYARYCA